eukprot:30154-Pelagococcus_subviridis.AAC.6
MRARVGRRRQRRDGAAHENDRDRERARHRRPRSRRRRRHRRWHPSESAAGCARRAPSRPRRS